MTGEIKNSTIENSHCHTETVLMLEFSQRDFIFTSAAFVSGHFWKVNETWNGLFGCECFVKVSEVSNK